MWFFETHFLIEVFIRVFRFRGRLNDLRPRVDFAVYTGSRARREELSNASKYWHGQGLHRTVFAAPGGAQKLEARAEEPSGVEDGRTNLALIHGTASFRSEAEKIRLHRPRTGTREVGVGDRGFSTPAHLCPPT